MSDMSIEIFPRIIIDPTVCFGKPTIRGMRIRVTDVLDILAGGATREEILDFPYLEDADITAALAYAARAVRNIPLPPIPTFEGSLLVDVADRCAV
jgi:uncharacterized protein (DUF433 family)